MTLSIAKVIVNLEREKSNIGGQSCVAVTTDSSKQRRLIADGVTG